MKINNTEIVDTYAEAFSMWSAKVIITAENDYWAEGAARAEIVSFELPKRRTSRAVDATAGGRFHQR